MAIESIGKVHIPDGEYKGIMIYGRIKITFTNASYIFNTNTDEAVDKQRLVEVIVKDQKATVS